MMNLHQRSVNVNKQELLTKLRENLEIHKTEYKEALVDFKERLLSDLKKGVKLVDKTEAKDLEEFNIRISFPRSHESDYEEVIEMLEMSTDETIELDSQSFKAYIKNEWQWSVQFAATSNMYKTGSFLSV